MYSMAQNRNFYRVFQNKLCVPFDLHKINEMYVLLQEEDKIMNRKTNYLNDFCVVRRMYRVRRNGNDRQYMEKCVVGLKVKCLHCKFSDLFFIKQYLVCSFLFHNQRTQILFTSILKTFFTQRYCWFLNWFEKKEMRVKVGRKKINLGRPFRESSSCFNFDSFWSSFVSNNQLISADTNRYDVQQNKQKRTKQKKKTIKQQLTAHTSADRKRTFGKHGCSKINTEFPKKGSSSLLSLLSYELLFHFSF